MSGETAELHINNEKYLLPLLSGGDGQKAINLEDFHKKTGCYLYDPLLNNVAIAKSAVTHIDPQKGKLFYRGYDVEDLVEKSQFVEVAYLLIHGNLPNKQQYEQYSLSLSRHALIHESMRNVYDAFPGNAHPLAILATMVTALSSYYADDYEEYKEQGRDLKDRLLSKVRTLAAWAYKKSVGLPTIYPLDHLPYCANLLNMMFAIPAEPYEVSPQEERILNQILILYSDHEQNIATSTVRLVGSAGANLFVCINAGICALWGARETSWKLHTVPMLSRMVEGGISAEKFFAPFIKGEEPLLSPAFGHKKYSGMGPRARISRKLFYNYLEAHPEKRQDALIAKALEMEQYMLGHPFFAQMELHPNLDFYSTLIFQMMDIPINMFNVLRVIGKLAGWLAHWEEQRQQSKEEPFTRPQQIRPQQLYSGPPPRHYRPIEQR